MIQNTVTAPAVDPVPDPEVPGRTRNPLDTV